MLLFTGRSDHTIDAKQRLAIPASMREELQRGGDVKALYAAPGVNGAIWLWPEPTFRDMAARIERSLMPAEELMEFAELTFPSAERLDLDANGRVRLPERLTSQARLAAKVIVLGVGDHIEIHDPSAWQRIEQERTPRRREIMLRARRVHLELEQSGQGGTS